MSGSAMTELNVGVAGFFGKLPGQGDFLSRRLSTEFLRVWDAWLQTALADSRSRLGDAWLDAYLTSPIWRFVLTAGIAGQSPWAGLLMPSVDRVGRYFPLTVACPLPTGINPFQALASSTDWFNQVQTLMLDALEETLSVDQMDARLNALAPALMTRSEPEDADASVASDTLGWRLQLADPLRLPEVVPGLLHRALTEMFFGYSLWWSEGSDAVSPSLLLCQGLPANQAFATLYTGDWTAGGWWNLGNPLEQPHRSLT
jgi:type VI secretion system protein ImpM